MRLVASLACLVLIGCSRTSAEPPAQSRELIPAEWTVAEDTSAAGEITTASLQLPAAKDISGLLEDGEPRLVLRCIDHKVEAFIDTEEPDTTGRPDRGTAADTSLTQLVPIQLDSAPACE